MEENPYQAPRENDSQKAANPVTKRNRRLAIILVAMAVFMVAAVVTAHQRPLRPWILFALFFAVLLINELRRRRG
jgi:Flp pilus assembly protein TadB